MNWPSRSFQTSRGITVSNKSLISKQGHSINATEFFFLQQKLVMLLSHLNFFSGLPSLRGEVHAAQHNN